ncbi:MAG: 2,3-bisphosphoglycerate-independent phosphoglycerate mutase [Erysipelothrix sp.]|nr:2,3-bisphosphoglycerate-independent phosphoglycerate mutase [Erysipelothrix sp.]
MKRRPVVLVIMDGVGNTESVAGNAVKSAYKPTLDKLKEIGILTEIKAHGLAVGLPSDDDMGNSEVGHNAIGSGQIYSQGAKLVNESIATGAIYTTDTWKQAVDISKDNTLHLIGLLSDGNVHSNIAHLKSLIENAKKAGVRNVRVHTLMDGRDVPETSGLIYVEDLESYMATLNDDNFNAKIASGGGRMYITMDRYDADWPMVERGWKTHVLGEGRQFTSASEAITTYREELGVNDQDLREFVIVEDGKPVGTIEDNDSVVFFNFRGDRAIEITRAFTETDFDHFDRVRVPNVFYAGMLQYDGDSHIPEHYLVQPPHIINTLTERLVEEGINEFAISETQKYGHVTYFWNGNKLNKVSEELETWVEVTSDLVPFDQRPWMQAAQITDKLIDAIDSREYDFLRVNYPNGDMVGHTGNFAATQIAVETVDLQLARVLEAADRNDVILLVTADHGNAEEMFEKKKKPEDANQPKTSHTTNLVPFYFYNVDVKLKEGNFGLANIAATITDLLDVEANPVWEESMIVK